MMVSSITVHNIHLPLIIIPISAILRLTYHAYKYYKIIYIDLSIFIIICHGNLSQKSDRMQTICILLIRLSDLLFYFFAVDDRSFASTYSDIDAIHPYNTDDG